MQEAEKWAYLALQTKDIARTLCLCTCWTVESYWTRHLVISCGSQWTVIPSSAISLWLTEAFIKTKAPWRTVCTLCLVPETCPIVVCPTGASLRHGRASWAVSAWGTYGTPFWFGTYFTVVTLLAQSWLFRQTSNLAEMPRCALCTLAAVDQACQKY